MGRRWPLALGFVAGLAALCLGLASGGDPVAGWKLAARWTARAGFPLLLITYCASSAARLWPGPATRRLWHDRRWWGLGFAACHTVHLMALLTYLRLSGTSRPLPVLLGGGGAYAVLYLMAFTSNQASMRALGANWRRLHTVGIHWLWGVYTFSYASRLAHPETRMTGAIGTALALAALGLRIAAWRAGAKAVTAPTARAESPAG